MRIRNLVTISLAGLLSLAGCAGTPSPRYTRLDKDSRKSHTEKRTAPKAKSVSKFRKQSLKKQWELYHVVKDLIHTPYRWGGTIPGRGMDCSGLTYYAYKERLGYNIPRTAGEQFRVGKKIPTRQLQFGDLVFFKKSPGKKTITHVGIYVNNSNFLHASSSRGVTVSKLDNDYWSSRLAGVRRIIN